METPYLPTGLTHRLDLVGGRPCWHAAARQYGDSQSLPRQPVDVAIVGSGITGAMIAERLTAQGRSVALLDRRMPGHGSTAASTAVVIWATDVPLTHLAKRIGLREAAARWSHVHLAVQDLADRVAELSLDCDWRARPEVYLAGTKLDAAALCDEANARAGHGLPSAYLDPGEVAARFALPDRAAIVSADGYECDPLALTHELLRRAVAVGASVTFPVDVVSLEHGSNTVSLSTADGDRLTASHVVLATGYEVPAWYLPGSFTLGSSFAIATQPGSAPFWGEHAMIWEASSPYLYARETTDGRIILGGEDETMVDPAARDAILGEKRGALEAKAATLFKVEGLSADCVWGATFGSSPDGLPAIGRARNADRVWLAQGFGGNGIAFASLAARLIAAGIEQRPEPALASFDPYRFS